MYKFNDVAVAERLFSREGARARIRRTMIDVSRTGTRVCVPSKSSLRVRNDDSERTRARARRYRGDP